MEIFLIPILFVIIIPIAAIAGISFGFRRIRSRRRAGRIWVSVGAVILLADLWVVVSGFAEFHRMGEFWDCQQNLGRELWIAINQWKYEHPGQAVPNPWSGEGSQLRCMGQGEGQPYMLFYDAINAEGAMAGDSIIACCPHAHRHYWWTAYQFTDRDCAVLFGDGHSELFREDELPAVIRQLQDNPQR